MGGDDSGGFTEGEAAAVRTVMESHGGGDGEKRPANVFLTDREGCRSCPDGGSCSVLQPASSLQRRHGQSFTTPAQRREVQHDE